jgi:hypothetical protein
VKVLNDGGSGTVSGVVAGLGWVVQNRDALGIEVVNLSLGVEGCSDGSDVLSQAVDDASDAGLVVVVAAGNEGPAECTVGAPGAAAGALTVGAMADTAARTGTADGGFYQAAFSSRGDPSAAAVKPDVSAPGVNIRSASAGTASGYQSRSGTSMAAPFVAGLSLLMLDANPALSPAQVKGHVKGTAEDWGPAGADVDYGAGRLDAYAALKQAAPALGAGPTRPAHITSAGSLDPADPPDEQVLNVQDLSVPIAATLIHTGVSEESLVDGDGNLAFGHAFDLVLLDPDGDEVARSRFRTRQEELGELPLVRGAYTLRVVPAPGSTASGTYELDVSAGLAGDTLPPQTRIGTAPSAHTSSGGAVFSFAAEPGAAFECKLDTGAFEDCASPVSLSGLGEGGHTFRIRARDGAGNDELAEELRRWTVDTTPPDTAIGSGPAGVTAEAGASFTFSSTEAAGARFQCSIDAGSFEPCTSPRDLGALGLGPHSFAVRAVDLAGNVDPSPASRSWTIATSLPGPSPASDPPLPPPPGPVPGPLAGPTARPVSLVVPEWATTASVTSRRGLELSVACLEACAVEARLYLPGRAAGAPGRAAQGRTLIGSAAAERAEAGRLPLAVRLTAGARRALRRVRATTITLELTLRDRTGSEQSFSRRIAVRRALSIERTATAGFPLALACSGPCTATGELLLPRAVARRLGLQAIVPLVLVGRGRQELAAAGEARLVLSLRPRARRALTASSRPRSARRRPLTFTLRLRLADGSGAVRLTRRVEIGL